MMLTEIGTVCCAPWWFSIYHDHDHDDFIFSVESVDVACDLCTESLLSDGPPFPTVWTQRLHVPPRAFNALFSQVPAMMTQWEAAGRPTEAAGWEPLFFDFPGDEPCG